MTSKTVLQSALAQWEALQKVSEAAREVLPQHECEAIDEATKEGATRTLELLDENRRKNSTPTSLPRVGAGVEADFEEEPTEVRLIRDVLHRAVGG